MNFSKKHLIPGLIGNLFVFILGVIGFTLLIIEPGDKSGIFVYFTVLSNILVILVSFIGAILYAASFNKGKMYANEFYGVIKLISVVCVAITFTMVVIFLAPADSTGFGWFKGSQLFMHALVPIASVFSFIFLEYSLRIRFRFFFTPIIAVFLYGVFYVLFALFASAGTFVDWYGFMFPPANRYAPVDTSLFTFGNFFLFVGESMGAALVFGFVFWLANKIMNLIFIGYVLDEKKEDAAKEDEVIEEEPIEEEAQEEEKPAENKQKARKTKTSAPKKYKGSARVYHISRVKFVSRQWQVKLATGEKAIKIFDTQAEAIDYAKKLTRTQGGSIRIHSMKGQLRK